MHPIPEAAHLEHIRKIGDVLPPTEPDRTMEMLRKMFRLDENNKSY